MPAFKKGFEPPCPLKHEGCLGKLRMKDAVACYNCTMVERGKQADQRARDQQLAARQADPDHVVLPRGFEAQWLEWQKYIGQAKERYAGPSKRPVQIGRQKIVIASDFHAPFQHSEYVAAMFERERDADLLIVGGDLQDFYSVSRFTKYEDVDFAEEMAAVTLLLEQMSERFPKVLIVEGNHDRPRFEKQLRDRLPQEMVNVITYLTGGSLSVIAAAAKRFPNIEMVKNTVDGRFDVGWYAQVNDLIVSHMEKFSIVPGSTLRGVEDWFTNFERVIGLEKNWRVIVQAHTHAMGWFPFKADKLLVESGCLCRTHGYQLTPRAGGRPQRQGYVTLVQNDGVTDFNSVRPVWLDSERP
jgi:predicted phosphodiesterase